MVTWHSINLDNSDVVRADVAGLSVLVIRVGDGWHAIEDRCSHADCAFSSDGELDGLVAVCDCHGSEFDIVTGEVLAAPAVEPIRTFPVRTTAAGNVELQL